MGRHDCCLNLGHSWPVENPPKFQILQVLFVDIFKFVFQQMCFQDSKSDAIWHMWVESLTFKVFILLDLVRKQVNQIMKIKHINLRIFLVDLFWQVFKLFSCSEFIWF